MIALPLNLSQEQRSLIEDVARTEELGPQQIEVFYEGLIAGLYGRTHDGPFTPYDIEIAVRKGLRRAYTVLDAWGY